MTALDDFAEYLKPDPKDADSMIFTIEISIPKVAIEMGALSIVAKSMGRTDDSAVNPADFLIEWVKIQARNGFASYADTEAEKRRAEVLAQIAPLLAPDEAEAAKA